MKRLFLVLLSISNYAWGQNIPREEIVTHLVKAGEISPAKKWDDDLSKVNITKFFATEAKALYCFSSKSIHHYNFLLLKDRDTFQIFNCNDFIEEYSIMEQVFQGYARDSLIYYMIPIIRLYQQNHNYHPTPPIPDLTLQKAGEEKLRYLPRKLPETKPFFYRCK